MPSESFSQQSSSLSLLIDWIHGMPISTISIISEGIIQGWKKKATLLDDLTSHVDLPSSAFNRKLNS
jgi:hypothetical protein